MAVVVVVTARRCGCGHVVIGDVGLVAHESACARQWGWRKPLPFVVRELMFDDSGEMSAFSFSTSGRLYWRPWPS